MPAAGPTSSQRSEPPVAVIRASRALAFLVINMLFGLVAMSVVITGLSLALGLAVTVIGGLACLAGTFVVARAFGAVQRAHIEAATGERIARPPRRPRASGFWPTMTAALRDASGWKAALFFLVDPLLATVTFSLVTSILAAGVAAVALPLYANRLEGFAGEIPAIGLALGALGGIAAVLAGLAGAVVAVQAHLGLARALLGPGRTVELESRVSDLDTARTAAIDAAEAERRRIERDLHDGTQQRLVALAMDLGRAREKFATDPESARALVDDAHAEVKATMAELRGLTRGLRPSVLEDRGLDAALSAVVARSPIPVDVDVELAHRPPPPVESAAYFVVSEALTNVARHSGAQHAAVRIAYEGPLLVVEVGDDGHGDARRVPGGGLDGLAERIAGLEGRLAVASPPGGPTLLRAELPCGS